MSASHRHRVEQLEGELASVQAQLHSANATAEQLRLQNQETTARCNKTERDLKAVEDTLGSLEGEHRKFVEQASAVCGQKDAAIAVCIACWSLRHAFQH